MMKYAINPDKQQVTAYLEDTKYDAVRHISKMLIRTGVPVDYFSPKLLMSHRYSGTVTLRDGDVWDEEKGKELAKAKCLANYYKGFDKRLNYFFFEMGQAFASIMKVAHNMDDCDHICECCDEDCTK